MSVKDPISDFLTRIRNAQRAQKDFVLTPHTRMNDGICKVLKSEGFIKDFQKIEEKPQDQMRVYLRYNSAGRPMIQGVDRISKPSCRMYATAEDLAGDAKQFTTVVVSTSKGIMSNRDASSQGVGGELICRVS